MEVSETLKEAWAAVEDAGLPEKIHVAAFKEAVRLLVPVPVAVAPAVAAPRAGKPSGIGGSGNVGGTGGGGSNGSDGKVTETEGVIFDRVESHTGVDRAKLENIAHVDDGVLKVSIPGIKLGRNNAEKTRAIAQILTIVRGFGLDEAETSVELVRAEAQRLKCYDQANFSSQLSKLSGYVLTGVASNRRIRSKSAGIQAFPGFVDSLLGAE